MYMSDYKKYSSTEAYEVAEMAKAKGLTLLEGNYEEFYRAFYHDDGGAKGYCIVKEIAGQYLTLADDYSVSQARELFDLPKTVYFNLTLAEAKERIMNFDGTIKNPPNFFAYVRLYDDEPKYFAQLQILYLEEFARRHKITYKHKFMYSGGKPYSHEDNWMVANEVGINNVIYDCKESFSLITENDFLVVSDIGRIDNQQCIYSESYILRLQLNIIAIHFEDMGYERYYPSY